MKILYLEYADNKTFDSIYEFSTKAIDYKLQTVSGALRMYIHNRIVFFPKTHEQLLKIEL